MREGKAAITDRLRAEGRWSAASKFKDEAINRLRAEGKRSTEARELAWEEMEKAFPSIEIPVEAAAETAAEFEGIDDEQIAALANAPIDHAADIRWCYRNMQNPRASVIDAPSLGAWGLLKHARANQQRFYETLMPKALEANTNQTPAATAKDDTMQKASEGYIRDIERFLGR